MEPPSVNVHPDVLQLLPMQQASAHAAHQLWDKAWKDTMQRMAVMVECLQTMQILATDLGIDQDVKSALAGENGAAEVQSIAFSVVGAVNTLLTQKEPDHNSEQHSPHLGEPISKMESAEHDGEHAPQPIFVPRVNPLPVFDDPLSLKASSQPDAKVSLANAEVCVPDSGDTRMQKRRPVFAPHPGGAKVSERQSAAHTAAAPSEPLQMTSSRPRHGGVTKQPQNCPSALQTVRAVPQPQKPADSAPLSQDMLPNRVHAVQRKEAGDTLFNAGECTPPRPAALLRETCLATPVSQRPCDAFNVKQQGQVRDSPEAAQMPRMDRYGIISPVGAYKEQERLIVAYDDQALIVPHGSQRSLPMANDVTAACARDQPLKRQAQSADATDSSVADLGGDHNQESGDDEDSCPRKPVWRVLGAQAGAKPQQAAHGAQVHCGVHQPSAPPADHAAALNSLTDVTAAAQRVDARACPKDRAFPKENCSRHNQDHVNAEPDAFQDSGRDNNCSNIVAPRRPSEQRSCGSVREGGPGGSMKGQRKAGGVWKPRKANLLMGKATKQGKSSGRIDRMLSHLNVPRSQQGNVSVITAGRHAQGLGSVAPAPVQGLERDQCSEDNLEQRRRAVHAKQTAMQDGGPKVYDERVRKRAERGTLPAWDCQGCAQFYAMLERQGYTVGNDVVRCPDCAADSIPGGDGTTAGQQFMQETSRHRHRFVAPPTPNNFWAIGFDDDWHGNAQQRDE